MSLTQAPHAVGLLAVPLGRVWMLITKCGVGVVGNYSACYYFVRKKLRFCQKVCELFTVLVFHKKKEIGG